MAKKSRAKARKVAASKKKGEDFLSRYLSMIVGIAAMSLLVIGTISEPGSLQQKLLFLAGAFSLGIVAAAERQKMFMALQTVATLGAILAFFPGTSEIAKYVLMIVAAIFALTYLMTTKYFKEDKYWSLGAIGLLLIALGFATDPARYMACTMASCVTYAYWFYVFLGLGGLSVALYSAISYFNGTRIAAIWLVLNLLFALNPLLELLKLLGL